MCDTIRYKGSVTATSYEANNDGVFMRVVFSQRFAHFVIRTTNFDKQFIKNLQSCKKKLINKIVEAFPENLNELNALQRIKFKRDGDRVSVFDPKTKNTIALSWKLSWRDNKAHMALFEVILS